MINAIVADSPLDREQVLEGLIGWKLHPYAMRGELAACAITKGPEIHSAVAPEFRHLVIQRHRIVEFLQPILHRTQYLTTRIKIDDKARQRFVEMIGFKPTWSNSEIQFYMLTKLRHAK